MAVKSRFWLPLRAFAASIRTGIISGSGRISVSSWASWCRGSRIRATDLFQTPKWRRATSSGRQANVILVGQTTGWERAGSSSPWVMRRVCRATTSGTRPAARCSRSSPRHWPTGPSTGSLPRSARVDLLVIDEFGFDRLKHNSHAQASTFYYRLLDARAGAAFDGPGDEHRLHPVGRVPGRSAVGIGISGPSGRRSDDPEAQRTVLPPPTAPPGGRDGQGRSRVTLPLPSCVPIPTSDPKQPSTEGSSMHVHASLKRALKRLAPQPLRW